MSIRIRLFGTFTITNGDHTISEEDNRSKKLWKLLQYIVANRGRHIPQEELVSLLWGEDLLDTPMSSLKTLLHRVRNTLDQLGFEESRRLILQRGGAYYWNTELPCVIDTDEFEAAAAEMEKIADPEEQLNCALKAMALYKGDFLGNKYAEDWVKEPCERYRSIYLTCYEKAIGLLKQERQFDEIIFLSEHALEIDPSQETFYYHQIGALIEKADYPKALETYENVLDLFYNTYRKTPSDKLRSLYRSIVKSANSVEMDIAIIQEKLIEECVNKPIFCEYDTFKLLYELKRQAIGQGAHSAYLILLTVNGMGSEKVPAGKHLDRALSQLNELMDASLGRGDVYTRYSVTQLLAIAEMESENSLFDFFKKLQHDFKSSNLSIPVELTFKADLVS